jgi:orotate phosphoribosyltransferase
VSLRDLLVERGAVIDGHFQLSSGNHSLKYVNKDLILYDEMLRTKVVDAMATQLSLFEYKFDTITGPPDAGGILAGMLAYKLGLKFVFAEKVNEWNDPFRFRSTSARNLDRCNLAVVEDVITTGDSVSALVFQAEQEGAFIAGIFSIWNRTYWKHPYIQTKSLIEEKIMEWEVKMCPGCRRGDPIIIPKLDGVHR